MCCRFYMELSPELRPYVEAAKRSQLKDRMIAKLGRPLTVQGEVRPTDIVPVVAPSRAGTAAVYPMVWGFSGFHAPLVNARSETASTKPTFRESWAKRRCAIPASWYYEWEHIPSANGRTKTGARYTIQPKGDRLMFLAGLYRIEEAEGLSYPVFTVLTRAAVDELLPIHDRMPVILSEQAIPTWIDPGASADDCLSSALTEMVFEKSADRESRP